MKQSLFTIKENRLLAPGVHLLRLEGDASAVSCPGQFADIKIDGVFLRRPFSVCCSDNNGLSVIYKTAGKGTALLAGMQPGMTLDVLTGLGNGFDTSLSGSSPLLIGGGSGVSPMYCLAKALRQEGKKVTAILGFASKADVFFEDGFRALGCDVIVTTADGSYGIKGFVTDAFPAGYSYTYACGPVPMLKAVSGKALTGGEYSFEKRMGCGFGACMGCTCRTVSGQKRICKDGPVLKKEEIVWED